MSAGNQLSDHLHSLTEQAIIRTPSRRTHERVCIMYVGALILPFIILIFHIQAATNHIAHVMMNAYTNEKAVAQNHTGIRHLLFIAFS